WMRLILSPPHDRRQSRPSPGRHDTCQVTPAARRWMIDPRRVAGQHDGETDLWQVGSVLVQGHTRRDQPSGMHMNDSADLLKELKIDRSAPPPRESRRAWLYGIGVAAVVLLASFVAWFVVSRGDAIEVRTARVVAIGNGNASASVLDATGYVVARRMATVSAKVTGKVREVLIEEGQRVEEGEVMATLDPVDA